MDDVIADGTEPSGNGDGPGPSRRALPDREQVKSYARAHWRELFAWSAIGLGGVAGFLAWVGVSGKDIAPLQLPYFASGGIAAVVLTIVGVGVLVGADLQRDRQRLGRIEGELVELQDLVRRLLDERPDGTSSPAPARSRSGSAPRRS